MKPNFTKITTFFAILFIITAGNNFVLSQNCTPPATTRCTAPATFTHTSIANGNWTSSSTWLNGIIPTTENINNKQIKITHDVTVQNNNLKLDNGTIIYISAGGRLTLRNGNLEMLDGNQGSTEKIIIENGSLRTSGNVQQSGSATVFCAYKAKLEIGDEDANPGVFTSGLFSGSSSTSADFQNTDGYRRLEDVCFNVTHDLQNSGGTDEFIKVCAEIGDRGKISGPHNINGGYDGDDNGNFQVQSNAGTSTKIYDSEFYIPNGNVQNSKNLLICNSEFRLTNGSFQNQSSGSITGNNITIWINHSSNGNIENDGNWNANTISAWRTDNSNNPKGLPGLITESSQQTIVSKFNDCHCAVGNTCVLPAPTVTSVQPTCTSNTGSIAVTAPTGSGFTYSIDGTNYQSGTTFSGLAPKTYNVTVKNADGCISGATPVTIHNAPGTPAAPTVTSVQPTCTSNTGSITVTAPTGSGFTYSIDGTNYQSGTTFSGLAPKTYNVTVKNADGCISGATPVTIHNAPGTPAAPTVTSVQPTCTSNTGSITVTAPTGSGFTYSIDGTNYQSGTTFSGLAPNTYNVTVKNADGCISGATPVTIHNAPGTPAAPTVTSVQPTCTSNTGSITVTAPTGSGFTYSIDGTNYQSGTTFSGLAPKTYNVTVKNADGCISGATPVTIHNAPGTPAAPTVTSVQPTCTSNTGSITVTAPTGSGFTYSIDGTNYQSGTTFSGLAPNTYNVTVKNADGCISGATPVTIHNAPGTPAAPTVTSVQPTCTSNTGSITVTAPTGSGFTYSIDGTNYQSGTTFSGLAPKTYNVTVKNADGCISGATPVTIHNAPGTPAAPTVTSVQPTCTSNTGSITVTAPTGSGFTYSIDGTNYQSGTTFSGLAPKTYNVTVKNADGCISGATPVTIHNAPGTPAAPTVTSVQPTCTSNTGSITVTAPTGSGFTYSIDGTNYQSGTTFSGLAPNTYNVTVKNADGCISGATPVTIHNAPGTPAAPTVTSVQPTCTSNTGSITVTAPTGSGFTYSIDGTNYQSGTTFSGLAPNTYNVTVKNADGCISGATPVTIHNAPGTPAAPTVTSVQPTCTSNTGSITVTAPTGSGFTYSIDGTNYQSGTTFSGLAPKTYNVTVKNADGCISGATPVTIHNAPGTPAAPTVTSVQPTCTSNTGSITVTAPTGSGFTYSIDGTNYQSGTTFSGLAPKTYNVTVKNADGCISGATPVTIHNAPGNCGTVPPPPCIIISVTPGICINNNMSITITATGGTSPYMYKINGGAYQSSNTFTNIVTGTYTIIVKDANGHLGAQELMLVVNCGAPTNCPTITANATAGVIACIGGKTTLIVSASGGTSPYIYSLDGGITNQTSNVFPGLVAGTYTVLVKDANGLTTATSVTIAPSTTVCRIGNSITVNATPNPYRDQISFEVRSTISGEGSIDIYNTLGSWIGNVYQGRINTGTSNFKYTVSVVPTVNLIYVLRLGDNSVSGKLLSVR